MQGFWAYLKKNKGRLRRIPLRQERTLRNIMSSMMMMMMIMMMICVWINTATVIAYSFLFLKINNR